MNERLDQFAHTLLSAGMPISEVYQECLIFAKTLDKRDYETVIGYSEITADAMEQSAQAVLDAMNKITEATMLQYREQAEQRKQQAHENNWMEWETKV